MFRIASRIAYRIIKLRQQKREVSDATVIDEASVQGLGYSETTDLIGQIPQWLQRPTPKGREAVSLHYLEGFTTAHQIEFRCEPATRPKAQAGWA